MKEYRFVRFLGNVIESVGGDVENITQEVVAEYNQDELPTEGDTNRTIADRVTTRLTQRIKERLNRREKGAVEFSVRAVSAQRDGSIGSGRGADLAVVFEADLPDYKVSKAALVQTRSLSARSSDDHVNTDHLQEEVAEMLERSSDSFILVFPVDGSVKVIPAVAVKALADTGETIPRNFPEELYTKSIGRFIEELAESYIGDQKLTPAGDGISALSDNRLREFIDENNLDTVLYVRVQKSEEKTTLKDFG